MEQLMTGNHPKILNIKTLILVIILGIFLSLPMWSSEYIISVFVLIFLYMALGQMWNLLAGYTGLVSLGQQCFIGLGGYSLAVITVIYKLPIAVGVFVGGVISILFALVISVPIFKMRGDYFTIGSWIVAESLAVFFSVWTFVRGGLGFNIIAAYDLTTTELYYMAICMGLGSVFLVYFLLRTKTGLALMAMRDNESAAETLGVELYKTKLKVFLIAALVTGFTGAFLYLSIAYIQPRATFNISWTVAMVFMVIIGGIGTIEGPILGAFFFIIIKQYLYNYPGISMIILGFIAILTILIAPKGIMGTLHERYGFEILSVRRR